MTLTSTRTLSLCYEQAVSPALKTKINYITLVLYGKTEPALWPVNCRSSNVMLTFGGLKGYVSGMIISSL